MSQGPSGPGLASNVARLVKEDEYAAGVQRKFASHVEQHAMLDALARCKALNNLLASDVRHCSPARSAERCPACCKTNRRTLLPPTTGAA